VQTNLIVLHDFQKYTCSVLVYGIHSQFLSKVSDG